MSTNGTGSDADRLDQVCSGPVPHDTPPLSCGRTGRPGHAVTEILQKKKKDTRETPVVSHTIFVSHTGSGGGACVVSLK